jgi:hypothetical protein
MPIIEPPIPDRSLTQGDVLKGVTLFLTKESTATAGGEHQKTSHKLCLVISRPCVVGHKPNAIVAAIEKMQDNVPDDVKTFKDIRDFLTDLRDGEGAPDVFYLGQVPGFEGRYSARLDSLHTIQIPDAAHMRAFTDQRRVGRLHDDFVRDLHTRIFRAFSTLGFDDDRWLSTQDLTWMVSRGQQEILEAEAALQSARTALSGAEAQGIKHPTERTKMENAITKAQTTLNELRQQVAPYAAELQARQQAAQG